MKRAAATIASLFLCMFFIGIMLFVMLGILKINESPNNVSAFVFAGIDFVLLLLIIGTGRIVADVVGFAMYPALCTAEVLYTILGLASTFVLHNVLDNMMFILIKLSLLFVFLCAAIPIVIIGSTTKRNEEERPEIRKHNLPLTLFGETSGGTLLRYRQLHINQYTPGGNIYELSAMRCSAGAERHKM